MNKAEQLIACLECEIAKRDETIARLEPQLNRSIQANYDLRAELASIKEQEPVAYIPVDRETGEEWHPVLKKGSGNICDYKPLYAAPVSEAKAQGVMQWPEADEIMQMAFEEGQPADDASGYCFELEEFDLFIERLMSEVARLNAAPVQQVSVLDGADQFDTPAEFLAHQLLIKRSELLGRPLTWREAIELTALTTSMPDAEKEKLLALDDPAPAAPAEDSGLVEALRRIMEAHRFNVSGMSVTEVHSICFGAIAAHRAKGVV